MIKELPLNLGYTASSKKLTETQLCQIGEQESFTIHILLIRLTSVHLEKNPIIDLETRVQKRRFWLLPKKVNQNKKTHVGLALPWRHETNLMANPKRLVLSVEIHKGKKPGIIASIAFSPYLSMMTGSEGVSFLFPQLFFSQHRL